jgi:hypothetical protein
MPTATSLLTASLLLSSLIACQPTILSAQDDPENPSPLQITTDFSYSLAGCKSGEGLQVQFHYTGTQPVRGYVIKLSFADPQTGKIFQQQAHYFAVALLLGHPQSS